MEIHLKEEWDSGSTQVQSVPYFTLRNVRDEAKQDSRSGTSAVSMVLHKLSFSYFSAALPGMAMGEERFRKLLAELQQPE